MNKRIFILLILLIATLLTIGCRNKRQVQKKPDNLINRNTMVNILAESYLIESTIHIMNNDTVDKTVLSRQYYKELFDRYGITREQFVNSVEYYLGEESSAEKILSDASKAITEKRKALNLPDSVWEQPNY